MVCQGKALRGAYPGPASARSVAGAAEQGHQRHQRCTCRSGNQHRLDRLFLDVPHGLVLHTNRLIAQSPGGVLRLGRGQSLDDVVRELRLEPVLQLGVSYSF